MKSSIKKMSALLTMMAVAILTFTFTACSDDDDPVTEVTYTYGFSSMSASHPDFLEEMGKIENAFQSALGITGKLFTKKGTIEECDKQVYEACRKAFDFRSIGARYKRIRKRPRGTPSPQLYSYKKEKLQELESLDSKG